MSDILRDLDKYCERIGYHGALDASQKTLQELHRAQILSIPFENLDIFLGRPIRLDPERLIAKLIDEKRGGYCYELNGLLYLVLERLGFKVTRLAARSLMSGPPLAQRSHKVLLVEVAGKRWLADVAFSGIGILEPLPLESADKDEYKQGIDTFRLVTDARFGFVLQRKLQEDWQALYGLTLEEHYPADYNMMNHFNSTSPLTMLTRRRTCGMPTADSRILLNDFVLKIRRSNETISSQLEDETAYREALQRYFGIVLPAGAVLKSPFPELPEALAN